MLVELLLEFLGRRSLGMLPPKIDAPAFLMKLISPMNWLPIAAGTWPSLSEAPPRHRVRTYPRTRRRGQGALGG